MMEALRPGGILTVQVLNLWRLADGPCLWQKCLRRQMPQGEVLIVKGVHRCDRRGYVELIVADATSGTLLAHESPQFLGLCEAEVGEWMHLAGAEEVLYFGGYAEEQVDFNPETSVDLVMVAKR